MPFRHRPLGVPEAELQRMLRLRRQAHLKALAPRTGQLAELRAATAELSEYHAMLGREIAALEAEAQELLRQEGAARAGEPDQPDPLQQMRLTLQYYQRLHKAISAGVLSLIAPYLANPDEKEGIAWPNSRTAGR